jgi:hypothetical protein
MPNFFHAEVHLFPKLMTRDSIPGVPKVTTRGFTIVSQGHDPGQYRQGFRRRFRSCIHWALKANGT